MEGWLQRATNSRLCAHDLAERLLLFVFRSEALLPLARVAVENLRRLTLHVRFPLPESQLAAHFHEACRILLRAEFDTAHIEVGSKSSLVEERHGIGRIADELAVSEGIGNEILRRSVFG